MKNLHFCCAVQCDHPGMWTARYLVSEYVMARTLNSRCSCSQRVESREDVQRLFGFLFLCRDCLCCALFCVKYEGICGCGFCIVVLQTHHAHDRTERNVRRGLLPVHLHTPPTDYSSSVILEISWRCIRSKELHYEKKDVRELDHHHGYVREYDVISQSVYFYKMFLSVAAYEVKHHNGQVIPKVKLESTLQHDFWCGRDFLLCRRPI